MCERISWEWGNDVLYRMCRDEPRHIDIDVIAAKLWLIGRSYAAPIERRSGQNLESDALYARVARAMKASQLDKWLEEASHIASLDGSNIGFSLAIHSRLVNLLRECAKLDRRSLASKYLHFHNPTAFFIFDSRASREIRRRVGRCMFKLPPECDPEYAAFALRCLAYRDKMRSDFTPRQLDDDLLGYHPVC